MFPDLFCDDVFTLETPRLFLRWPKAQDEAGVHTLLGDKSVAEMTRRIPFPYPREEAARYILSARGKNAEGAALLLAITARKQPQNLIGAIGVEPDGEGSVEIGYWLGRPFWGQGLMTEAAQAMIDAVFLYTDVKEINASIRVLNSASRTVLERCGFQQAGGSMCIRPAWGDSVPSDCYRLTRGVWTRLKGWRAPLPVDHRLTAESNLT